MFADPPAASGTNRLKKFCAAAALFWCIAAPLAAQAGSASSASSGALAPGGNARGDLIGALVDSVHGRALADATVTVLGMARHATSGNDGMFRFDSLPAGTYTLSVAHPLLDTLGIDINSRPIVVAPGRVVVVRLSTPSRSSIRESLCAHADAELTPGIAVGRLRDADTGAPAVAASVSLAYTELRVSPTTGVRRISHVRKAAVTADGRYVICGLPARLRGTLQATRGADATAEVAVVLQDDTLLLRSMTLGSASLTRDAVPSGLADSAVRLRALASIEGRVIGIDGKPLAGAAATVTGTTVTGATTEGGEFSLRSLPSGTRELVVRKIGYESVTLPVELTRREPRKVAVTLLASTPTLATVQVKGNRENGLKQAGFLDRKAMGMGYFVTPEMIDSLRPRALSDLLGTAPGIQVTTTDWGTQIQSTRSVAVMKDACVNVFVDRVPWSPIRAGDLDSAFPVADVVAVEVYGGNSVPSEFTMLGRTCATVVVWTRTSIGKP